MSVWNGGHVAYMGKKCNVTAVTVIRDVVYLMRVFVCLRLTLSHSVCTEDDDSAVA